MTHDYIWMAEAMQQALDAAREGEVPVGAIVVLDGAVIGRGRNGTMRLVDPTAHAEVLALREAATSVGHPYLLGSTLYVTLEPCAMCAGAAVAARVERVVFGAYDERAGAAVSLYAILHDDRLNHRCDVLGGVMDIESRALLRDYFVDRRTKPGGTKASGGKRGA